MSTESKSSSPRKTSPFPRKLVLPSFSSEPFSLFPESTATAIIFAFIYLEKVKKKVLHILVVEHSKLQCWMPPWWHVESHEKTFLAALLREAQEEVGIILNRSNWFFCDVHGRRLLCPYPISGIIYKEDLSACDMLYLFHLNEDKVWEVTWEWCKWIPLDYSFLYKIFWNQHPESDGKKIWLIYHIITLRNLYHSWLIPDIGTTGLCS